MAASVRSSGAATLANTTTSVTVAVPGDVQVGDVVYAVVVNGGVGSAPSGVPSGWSLVVSAGTSSGTDVWGGVYRIVWPGGGQDTTPTWSGFTTSCTACCVVVQGADTSSAPERDTSARANTTGSGCNGVDANADDLILAFAAVDDDAGTTSSWACATNPTSLTQVRAQTSSGGNDTLASIAQATKTATGNTGALSYTVSGADDNTGLLVAVKSPSVAPPSQGSAFGSVAWSGAVSGSRASKGSASGAVTRVGAATGSTVKRGAVSGTVTRVATVSGSTVRSGSAAGTLVRTGQAAGSAVHAGTATGTVARSGTAAGSTVHRGSASGLLARVGHIVGTAPAEAIHRGSVAGSIVWTGTVTGSAPHRGTATGAVTWVGTADGTAPLEDVGRGDSIDAEPPPEIHAPTITLDANASTAALDPNLSTATLDTNAATATATPNNTTAEWRLGVSTLKQNDTAPSAAATILDGATPVDLTGATVRFNMAVTGQPTKVSAPGVVSDAVNGRVRYDWQQGDTDVPGVYQCEWEVTWGNGTVQTFPPASFLNLTITKELDTSG